MKVLLASGMLDGALDPWFEMARRKSSRDSDQELERFCFNPVTFQPSSDVSPGCMVWYGDSPPWTSDAKMFVFKNNIIKYAAR